MRQNPKPPDLDDNLMPVKPPDIPPDIEEEVIPEPIPQAVNGIKNPLVEGIKASGQSLWGFAKGATVDIPSNIMGGLSSIGNLISDPVNTIKNMPSDIANMGRSMWDTTKQAGQDPEAFGRMMGNIGGQPLVTAGMAKGAPGAYRMAGAPVEGAGRIMRQHQPLSGMIPRMVEPRVARTIERGVGRGIENIGKRMRTRTVEGEVVEPPKSNILDADIINETYPESIRNLELSPSHTTQTGTPANRRLLSRHTEMEAPSPTAARQAMDDMLDRRYGFTREKGFGNSKTNVKPPDTSKTNVKPPVVDKTTNNASGESAASVESINRTKSMKSKGEQFVVYDRMGNKRPLIGPEAVDYVVQKGEAYGIDGPNGFQLLDDNGGIYPEKLKRKIFAIERNVTKKGSASDKTQKYLSDLKRNQ